MGLPSTPADEIDAVIALQWYGVNICIHGDRSAGQYVVASAVSSECLTSDHSSVYLLLLHTLNQPIQAR